MHALIISSQVVHGSVGSTAMRAGFEAAGVSTYLLPTIVLSNHPGHGISAGQTLAPKTMTAMIDALGGHGWLAGIDAIVSGYLKTAGQADAVIHALDKVARENGHALYCCDPVMGDWPGGLYVSKPVKRAILEKLAPRADILTPNLFELAILAGTTPKTQTDVIAAARGLDANSVLVTSAPSATPNAMEIALVEPGGSHIFETGRREKMPHGTGDLLAGLFIGSRLAGATSADALERAGKNLARVIDASEGLDDLNLAALAKQS